mmetsp:Transcript_17001/g.49119  ORF Transcript_17001/g.49119 Transcript_17001/m.49119 type:complete len:208 (+) Transcript_17001:402-1025(+)
MFSPPRARSSVRKWSTTSRISCVDLDYRSRGSSARWWSAAAAGLGGGGRGRGRKGEGGGGRGGRRIGMGIYLLLHGRERRRVHNRGGSIGFFGRNEMGSRDGTSLCVRVRYCRRRRRRRKRRRRGKRRGGEYQLASIGTRFEGIERGGTIRTHALVESRRPYHGDRRASGELRGGGGERFRHCVPIGRGYESLGEIGTTDQRFVPGG